MVEGASLAPWKGQYLVQLLIRELIRAIRRPTRQHTARFKIFKNGSNISWDCTKSSFAKTDLPFTLQATSRKLHFGTISMQEVCSTPLRQEYHRHQYKTIANNGQPQIYYDQSGLLTLLYTLLLRGETLACKRNRGRKKMTYRLVTLMVVGAFSRKEE